MATFNPENPGTWFYFNDNEDEGGVCLRTLSEEEIRRIEKVTTDKKIKFKRGIRYDETKIDEKKYSRLMWDYVITDWKNVIVDGQEVECNTENKVRLIQDPNFASFIGKAVETLNDDIESGRNLAKN